MAVPSDAHLDRLRALISQMDSVLVCYSGGIDSALVLAVAHEVLGEKAVGMTAVSPSLAPYEKQAAVSLAKQIGSRHELVDSSEIDDPRYQVNNADRCFYCKSELYRISSIKQQEWSLGHVVNGTNLDDLGDYRPGLLAAKEAGVRSPLVECEFRKDDVRRVAQLLGVPIWDKPASACLSSRLPYGTSVTRERLAQIGGLEAELLALGFRQVRVRWHALGALHDGEANSKNALARLEFGATDLARAFEQRDVVVDAAKRYGFQYVTLDLQGYRTGSHNEVLVGRHLRLV